MCQWIFKIEFALVYTTIGGIFMNTLLHTEILPKLCKKNNFKYKKINEWCAQISNGKKEIFIYYYNFPCNNLTSHMLAKDKALSHEFMKKNNLPSVVHTFIPYSNCTIAEKFLNQHKKVVVKDSTCTCGFNVSFAQDLVTLENEINNLKNQGRTICLSPYETILKECRIILVNHEPQIIYEKIRPSILGDGKSTIENLLKLKFPNCFNQYLLNLISNIKKGSFEVFKNDLPDLEQKSMLQSLSSTEIKNHVLPQNSTLFLNWKHNLYWGASIKEIKDLNLLEKLKNLAIETSSKFNLMACAVDIILTPKGLKILEVNSGLMMESFSKISKTNYKIAQNIYEKALKHSF